MRLEDRGDHRPVPSEDQLLHGSSWPNAARPEHGHTFSPFATHAVVRNPICVAAAQLDPQLLRRGIVSRRVDVGKIALSVAQIEKVRAFDGRFQNLEIQVLSRCLRRVEK